MDIYEEQDFSIEHDVFYNEQSDNNRDKPCIIRWKSGKRVDPRLLTTLESFKEIYDERRDMFKKIFSGMYNEFVEVFNKLGEMMERNKEARSMEQATTLQRSLSFGSPRASTSRGIEVDNSFVDEKFKVRPPTVVVGGSDGKGAQTAQGNAK